MVGYKQQGLPQCPTNHEEIRKEREHCCSDEKVSRLPVNPNVTFFEIVTPYHGHTRSHSADLNPRSMKSKPKIIAIIEENTSAPYQIKPKAWSSDHDQNHVDFAFTFSSSPSNLSISTSCDNLSDQTEDEDIDELHASLLPDFFSYTSAEREFIRQYQPLIFQTQRKQLSLAESSETSCFWAT